MSDIDWSQVTQPFLPNILDEQWITEGQVEAETLPNGHTRMTNSTARVTVEAPSFDEAIRELNLKVQEALKSNKTFVGRGY